MKYEDEIPTETRAVRSFIVTGGRARTEGRATELALETLVDATPMARRRVSTLQFERRSIVQLLVADGATSIAEISAQLELPMRASQVLVSEMVADGVLSAQETVSNADVDLLLRIRSTIAAL
ncbi:MAG: DUF742 domain-containing protein [Acidimicrobiales bacterium]